MDEKLNKKSDEPQVIVYADRQGRGWQMRRLFRRQKCYSIRCQLPAVIELSRIAGTLARRELLCWKCFSERVKAWEMKVKGQTD